MEFELVNKVTDNLEKVGMVSEKPPEDKYHAVYLIILLHGIGVLMPWNMFITIAPSYYVDYKFTEVDAEGMKHKTSYALNFYSYLGLASHLPNLILNFSNLFIQIGGGLGRRISFSLITLTIICLITLVFTVINTSHMTTAFFFITMVSVVILNAANGIYQNSLYGLVAAFPPRYTNAIILGNNICGTFISVISIITIIVASSVKIAALLYFSISLMTILACLGSLFILQKLEFYNYYVQNTKGTAENKENESSEHSIKMGDLQNSSTGGYVVDGNNDSVGVMGTSFITKLRLYVEVFEKIWIQCFNVWCVFFVTLAVFPAVMADIKYHSKSGRYDFFIPEKLFTSITTYLLFNFLAAVGSFSANFVQWPSSKWLVLPVVARLAFIPLLMFCYFRPEYRTWSVWIYNVWIYIVLASIMSITNGYFSSLGMMYAPKLVESSKSPVAAMIAAFFLVLGVTSGVAFTFFISWFINSAGPHPPGKF